LKIDETGFLVMTRSIVFVALTFCGLLAATGLSAQSAESQLPPAEVKAAPILPPEGFDDGRGYVLPGVDWAHATPASEGFSPARLEALRAFLKTHQTDGMMIVSRGHVVFEYGDLSLVSKVASVRKSVLDLLFAVEAHHGLKLDDAMNQNVVQLGLQDKTPFNELEQHATLEQIMMSRSGIYIPSGNEGQEKILPKRGSAYPGTRFFYNNWDFDAAGFAFEKLTHKDIFDALRDDLAIPLRFQDFDRSRQRKNFEPSSTHFEYATYLSTRDMARLGLFALRSGDWGQKLWGDPGTIQFSTYPTTHFNEVGDWYWSPGSTGRWGYGILWWAWDAPKYPGDIMTGPFQGAFSAMGSGGQYITAFPMYDIVVAHKVNIDKDESRSVSGPTYMTILEMVLDAKCGAPGEKTCK
jgi:CubicO group peptidase (beta-lactamase class C family)